MKIPTIPWMLTAALVLWSAPVRAGELEARLDRSSVTAGETLQLLLRHRGGSREPPDLTPLEADFEVLDVRRSHRTTFVNGQRDASVDWLIRLAPRRSGRIEIPVLRAGAAESQPLRLEVASARPSPTTRGEAASPAASPVLVEVEVDAVEPYVQSKVLLTVRVLAGPEVIDGALADPVIEGAVVERVGEDRHGRRDVAGISHRVIERQYAVFPQRSGELEISPLVFEGRVRTAPARRPRDPIADFLPFPLLPF